MSLHDYWAGYRQARIAVLLAGIEAVQLAICTEKSRSVAYMDGMNAGLQGCVHEANNLIRKDNEYANK